MSNENKIRILYVQPGKYPEERLVTNELPPPSAACRWGFCTSRSAANRWTRWQTCTALRKTSGTFCTSCFPRKCVPACLLCAAGLPLPMASCAGRCRVTPIYPATSGKWMPSAMLGIAARIFPRRKAHPSWLPTAELFWSAAGTTATAIRCCWITARACHTLCPYDANCRYRR